VKCYGTPPVPSRDLASCTEPSTEQNMPSNAGNHISYSSIAAAAAVSTNGPGSSTTRPVNFRDAIAVAMYADSWDKERRAKSVVVSGLAPRHDITDAASFRQLCSQEFGLDPSIVYMMRLSVGDGDCGQPLLIGLHSAEEALSITNRAKLLRQAPVESVRSNVFINYPYSQHHLVP